MRRTALVALVLLALSGCSSDSTDDSTVTQPTGTPTTAGGTGTDLVIQSFSYRPSPLTVAPGAVISVDNRDSQTHTATSDVAGLFDSGDADKGTPVTFKAPTKGGTYTFHCTIHPSMHGTLVVK